MLKDDIIRILEENRGKPVSGQEIADTYNVSRNAVWKAINSLKESGYNIISGRNSGYYIDDNTDVISEQGIRHYLSEDNKELKIRKYNQIDSTNNEAKRLIISEDIDRMLLVANEQTAGRGRMGRAFYSPGDTGIYMSLIYKVPGGVKAPMLITMAAAVAVARTIEKFSDNRPSIKWVNDIYLGEKKVCGILTEAVTDLETGMAEKVVVGIGINVKTKDFPDELKKKADSLGIDKVSRNELIAGVTDELIKLYGEFNSESFMKEYIDHNNVVGRKIKYERNEDTLVGTVEEICMDGSLNVKAEDGIITNIFTGEILFFNQ